ncbi:hypothetical protein CTKA_01869 [Chthonomonas calidirosea]|uniref:Uncharacterized protein conserved in bacteria n=1 Tax=Chthonomonas calidirosea (strain DSM 23976 / ICMP 18418 / T49) TaxID=1303518 RepID=S0EW12_CHTCT|nr:lysophospholipid acyltransferase family protein [Chthonomonas calidirosea]CCW36033.1 Uncharacterized protein conserved in bacteria [Chthonomonas calidirosea T49]CEK18532.1 hypothetical protein CTKA_01869 [Chthonomonas calidirosea]
MDTLTQPSPETSTNRSSRYQQVRELKYRVLSWLIWLLARAIYKTLRVQTENMQSLVPSPNKGAILVTWHGRTFIAANILRNRGYWALISLSRDGELQNRIFRRFGFQTVRGSTGRGGVRGALEMARKVQKGEVLAFTPDGPRGPTHKVQPGVILMAEKSGAPIVPVGISASRRILIRSWDSYLIPLPFARAFFLVGDPIYVPPNLDENGRLAYAAQLERALNRMEREAERRAGYPNYPSEWATDES